MPVIPEEPCVNAGALIAQLKQQLEDRATAAAKLINDALESQHARISELEADLAGARFATQLHVHTVEHLTKINADLMAAMRDIRRAAGEHPTANLACLAIIDMTNAALRQAGQP